jgi:hypothetical protein
MPDGAAPAMKARIIPAVLCIAFLIFSGCKEDLVMNEEFSINMIQPGPKWPNVKKLTSAQKEVYERNGRPDHFRVWWLPNGEIRTRGELHGVMKDTKPSKLPPHSWVYLRKGKEILFRGNNYEELPINDEVRTLAKFGDPEDMKMLDSGLTQWQYFGAGKLFKFSRGKIVEQKDFPAMGQFIK